MEQGDLYFQLKPGWFVDILRGDKKEEYRDILPKWTRMLLDRAGNPVQYKQVYFRNGYEKKGTERESPMVWVEYKELEKRTIREDGAMREQYIIFLGNILRVKNLHNLNRKYITDEEIVQYTELYAA